MCSSLNFVEGNTSNIDELWQKEIAQLAGAVEYTDCASAEG